MSHSHVAIINSRPICCATDVEVGVHSDLIKSVGTWNFNWLTGMQSLEESQAHGRARSLAVLWFFES